MNLPANHTLCARQQKNPSQWWDGFFSGAGMTDAPRHLLLRGAGLG